MKFTSIAFASFGICNILLAFIISAYMPNSDAHFFLAVAGFVACYASYVFSAWGL